MISTLIDKFKTHSCVVTRTVAGSHVDGKYVEGSSTQFTVDACIQPLSSRQLMTLPEGQRTEENRMMFCRTEIKTRGSLNDPDIITFNGEDWVVLSVEEWAPFDRFFKAIISKRNTQ